LAGWVVLSVFFKTIIWLWQQLDLRILWLLGLFCDAFLKDLIKLVHDGGLTGVRGVEQLLAVNDLTRFVVHV
jgi:hypothetical protein